VEDREQANFFGRLFGAGGVGGQEIADEREPTCGLAVVLPGGRRIEVHLTLIRVRSNACWASWSGRKPCLDWVPLHGSIWPPGSPTCAGGARGRRVWFGIVCRVTSERAPVLVLERPTQSAEGPRLGRKRTLGLCRGELPCSQIKLRTSLCGSAERGAPFEIIRRV
jgi:hypothetical protein